MRILQNYQYSSVLSRTAHFCPVQPSTNQYSLVQSSEVSPEDQEICRSRNLASRGPRDCPRAKPKGNLEGRGMQNQCCGKSRGPRVGIFQWIPTLVILSRTGGIDFSFWAAFCVLIQCSTFHYNPVQSNIVRNIPVLPNMAHYVPVQSNIVRNSLVKCPLRTKIFT